MLGQVAVSVSQRVEEDMQRAIKGIVTVRRPSSPKAKPVLNVDDESVGEEFDGSKYDDQEVIPA